MTIKTPVVSLQNENQIHFRKTIFTYNNFVYTFFFL